MEFSLASGKTPIPPEEWRPDWSLATPEGLEALRVADARQGLPECHARWEERIGNSLCDVIKEEV